MNQPIPWNTKKEIHFASKSTCTSGAKKLFLAPLKSYLLFSTTEKLFGATTVEL